ncbi:MAG TPA: hypothetical protein VMY42_14500 [Thermoguttaceae bacterium]|nr:hypothetical protein [Thermoguttaceae bacterium]
MSLQDWLSSRWLTEHETGRGEITDLLGVIDRDLGDCRTPGLSSDWKLTIAYNAVVQAATAALAAAGYRAGREAHHFRVIQSLAYTIGIDSGLIAQLDAFRKKRNISDYERAGAVSEAEAREMVSLAERLRDELVKWLAGNHSELLPDLSC